MTKQRIKNRKMKLRNRFKGKLKKFLAQWKGQGYTFMGSIAISSDFEESMVHFVVGDKIYECIGFNIVDRLIKSNKRLYKLVGKNALDE